MDGIKTISCTEGPTGVLTPIEAVIHSFEADKAIVAGAAAVKLASDLDASLIRSACIQLSAKRAAAGDASTVTFTVRHSLDNGTTWLALPIRKSDGTWAANIAIAPTTAGYLATESQEIFVEATGGLISVWASCITNDAAVSAIGASIPVR